MALIVTLISYVFMVFLTLWLFDIYFTYKATKKLGKKVEINPIIKWVIGIRGSHLWAYKTFEIVAFSLLTYYIAFQAGEYMLSILNGVIIFYALIVSQGLLVYSKIYSSAKPAVFLMLLLVLYTLFFINLNYQLFFSSTKLSDALNQCNSEYATVYNECKGEEPPKDFSHDFDLNLMLPGA